MDNKLVIDKIEQAIKSLIEVKNSIEESSIQVISGQDAKSDFDILKESLFSDNWPSAVNPHLICNPNSEQDKKDRGIGIIELVIEKPLSKEERFLDFGCGGGHCVIAAQEIFGCQCVGYDKKKYDWQNSQNVLFSTSFEEVQKSGPYDAILLFDVIDHCEENPVDILKMAASVLSPNGKIYMRCHPWISRHGTHLYTKLNKAFIHLVFNDEEIKTLIQDYQPEKNQKVIKPLSTYDAFVAESGLKKESRQEIKDTVEPFFKTPKLAQRIIDNTSKKDFLEFQMSLSFVDYVLTKESVSLNS